MSLNSSLKQHQRRLILRTFVLELAVGLSVSLTATGILLMCIGLLQFQWPSVAVPIGAVLAAVLYASVRTIIADTSLLSTAKLLERLEPSLHSRLSTALELSASGQNDTPVRRAQLLDAVAFGEALDGSKLIRFELGRRLRTAMLIGSLVLALGTALLGPLTASSSHRIAQADNEILVDTASEQLSDAERSTLISDLDEIVEVIEETIEKDDVYLEAIGRQMRQLAEELENDENFREDTVAELERLLEHLQTALGVEQDEPDPQLARMPERLEDAIGGVEQPNRQDSLPIGNSTPQTSADAGSQSQSASDTPSPVGPENQDQSSNGPGTAEAPSNQPTRSRETFLDNVMNQEDIAIQNDQVMDNAEMAQPGGGGDGESPVPPQNGMPTVGQGAEALFGTEAAAELNAEQLEELEVAAETDPDGRRVEIDLTPEAEFTEVRMTPLGEMTWNRQLENEVVREALTSDQRQASARYHTPEQDTAQ